MNWVRAKTEKIQKIHTWVVNKMLINALSRLCLLVKGAIPRPLFSPYRAPLERKWNDSGMGLRFDHFRFETLNTNLRGSIFHLSKLAGWTSQFANGTRLSGWTKSCFWPNWPCSGRAMTSVATSSSLSSEELTNSFCGLAVPVREFWRMVSVQCLEPKRSYFSIVWTLLIREISFQINSCRSHLRQDKLNFDDDRDEDDECYRTSFCKQHWY